MLKKLAGLTAIAGLFIAGTASAQGIDGSAHDFVGATWYSGDSEICKACHAPHNNQAPTGDLTDMPLWNHTPTSTTVWTVYDSGSMDATAGDPTGVSKLCLSCHDGTVAVDSFGGSAGTNTDTMTTIAPLADVGTTLNNDHPISIDYVDTGLVASTTNVPALGGDIATTLLFNNSVECGSCHDVHNTQGNSSLLKIDNSTSGLCQTCHAK